MQKLSKKTIKAAKAENITAKAQLDAAGQLLKQLKSLQEDGKADEAEAVAKVIRESFAQVEQRIAKTGVLLNKDILNKDIL